MGGKRRKKLTTPKGEAGKVLGHAEDCLSQFVSASSPEQKEIFVQRLNDFLACTRKVPRFLGKEAGRPSGLELWVKKAHDNLLSSDSRYAYFCTLRDVSEHDCIVRPDTAQQTVEITSRLRISGHFEGELHDAESGRVTARVTYDSPVGAEGVHEETRIRTNYFFMNRANEDVVTFCTEILNTLRTLVNDAYQLFP